MCECLCGCVCVGVLWGSGVSRVFREPFYFDWTQCNSSCMWYEWGGWGRSGWFLMWKRYLCWEHFVWYWCPLHGPMHLGLSVLYMFGVFVWYEWREYEFRNPFKWNLMMCARCWDAVRTMTMTTCPVWFVRSGEEGMSACAHIPHQLNPVERTMCMGMSGVRSTWLTREIDEGIVQVVCFSTIYSLFIYRIPDIVLSINGETRGKHAHICHAQKLTDDRFEVECSYVGSGRVIIGLKFGPLNIYIYKYMCIQ